MYLFLTIYFLWLWANSIFAPWAESPEPRLWLYDLLYYTRFALLFWGGIEFLLACRQLGNAKGLRRRAFANLFTIGFAVLSVSAYLYLMHTGSGFRLRVKMSASALTVLEQPGFSDRRTRIGWFLVDNQRQPCIDEPWLWLGEAYGGGSGNNMALVYSERSAPKTPDPHAFRFLPLTGHWWLAYQNPERYNMHLNDNKSCVDALSVKTHEQGMLFIGTSATN